MEVIGLRLDLFVIFIDGNEKQIFVKGWEFFSTYLNFLSHNLKSTTWSFYVLKFHFNVTLPRLFKLLIIACYYIAVYTHKLSTHTTRSLALQKHFKTHHHSQSISSSFMAAFIVHFFLLFFHSNVFTIYCLCVTCCLWLSNKISIFGKFSKSDKIKFSFSIRDNKI